MKNRMVILAALLGVVVSSFSTLAYAVNVPEAKPDKGLVVFYRKNLFAGKAIRFNINHQEGPLGQLLAGTMLYKYVKPGAHQFWSQVISQDAINLNVEAGKVYYVQGEVLLGIYAGRPKFRQMSEAEAKADLENLNKK